MHEINFKEAVELICAKDGRYGPDAYQFVKEALDHTQTAIGRDNRGRIRHVTGQELLEGIREYATTRYGPMAMLLLNEWGIQQCSDFGDIVFNLIDVGLLAKTDTDSRADFAEGYEFFEAFRKPYLPAAQSLAPEPKPAPSRES